MAEGIRRRAERIIRENFDTGNRLAVKIAIVALQDSQPEIDRLRAALQRIIDAPMIDHANPENSAQAIARAALESE